MLQGDRASTATSIVNRPPSVRSLPPDTALRGRRTSLRRLAPSDAGALVELVTQNREFHASWITTPETEPECKNYLVQCQSDSDACALGVFHTSDGCLVGVFSLAEIVQGESARLGYYAARKCAGQGLMLEGIALALEYSFNVLQLKQLTAAIQPENIDSIRLVTRAGFRHEGSTTSIQLRGLWLCHTTWIILRDTWRASLPTSTAGI